MEQRSPRFSRPALRVPGSRSVPADQLRTRIWHRLSRAPPAPGRDGHRSGGRYLALPLMGLWPRPAIRCACLCGLLTDPHRLPVGFAARPVHCGAVAGGSSKRSSGRAAVASMETEFSSGRRRARSLHDRWKQATVLEAGLMALIGILGMNDNWYQLVALIPHLPAVLILSRMGACCGFASHLVISDVGMSYWGGLRLAGVPMLMIGNFAALVPFLMLVWFARRRIDHARRASP